MLFKKILSILLISIIETALNSLELSPNFVFDSITYKFYCDISNGCGGHKPGESKYLSLPSTVKIENVYHTGYDDVVIKDGDTELWKFT
jgi:hypothetical protein